MVKLVANNPLKEAPLPLIVDDSYNENEVVNGSGFILNDPSFDEISFDNISSKSSQSKKSLNDIDTIKDIDWNKKIALDNNDDTINLTENDAKKCINISNILYHNDNNKNTVTTNDIKKVKSIKTKNQKMTPS